MIVGVGGFLGMGEKNVALPYGQLTFARDADGALLVTTKETKESLQSAPEWKKPEPLVTPNNKKSLRSTCAARIPFRAAIFSALFSDVRAPGNIGAAPTFTPFGRSFACKTNRKF